MSQPFQPGPVMLDLAGTALTPEEREQLACPAAGGVILFSRNYQTPEQITQLIAEIRAVRGDLLVAVDHEGGRVQRFRAGFTHLPPAVRYGAAGNGAELAEAGGWLMAAELRAVGVDFSFAPVLDLDGGVSAVIGDRAFGAEPETVTALALAFARGMRRAGMAAVGKHFPGHGGVAEDSHRELPVDRRSYAALEAWDLRPFRALIRAGLEGILSAHVVYPSVDERPAGFSPFWLREVLRRRLGFAGAVFSDDLSMAGAAWAGDPVERAGVALAAGCDMVLVCNAPGAAGRVLERLAGEPPDPGRINRLARLRGGPARDRATLLATADWRKAADWLASCNGDTT
ncbi:beta-N-acetylhexosaminidase [Candidatus Methylocalor cossyra]|uniref:Beta-hexosaminidase n=1 Tax=Candidatus Methylocalor cossyra TaxID=3108543 RepID=A0ABP1CA79_9GAMM